MRMISCCMLAAVAMTVSFSTPARAEFCTIDAVPAATLLLPYFEIDLAKPYAKAEDWVFSINNASAAPVIAHVVLWSDLSVPTFDFDIYLDGYDVQAVSLRDFFFLGFDGLPQIVEPPFSGLSTIEEIRDAHVGRSVNGGCYGRSSGRKARGYVTIDSVNQFTVLNPGDGGYFDDVVEGGNVLWGQYYVTKKAYISAENLVHVEAGSNSRYTFYGRYVDFGGSDQREPLGQAWAARYFNNAKNKTYLIVWRDSAVEQGPFNCNGLEGGWYPLGQTQIITFDAEENAMELTFDPGDEPFPAETQEVRIGGRELPTPFTTGWIYLNLADDAGLQSLIIVRQDFRRRRSHHMANQLFFEFEDAFPEASSACGSAPNQTDGPIP